MEKSRCKKAYDMEFMRMAMLKHEETFKEQVYELHRLYRIQKILMRNVDKSRSTNRHVNYMQHKPSMKLELEQQQQQQPTAEYSNGNYNGMLENIIIDESEIELTLGPTSYSSSRRKKPASPPTSDSGPSFSSSNNNSSGSSHIINRQNNRSSASRRVMRGCELGIDDTLFGYQSGSKNTRIDNNSNEEEDLIRQERLTQSPWLLQVLSLNMT
ncbi:hypothetical protein LWI28_010349 [Acer negundo]|uniref:Uncharacterized protein n=1 Tax=Acer negundo TaxID=4023 RepID=A0AAD5NLI9_ACENE|nr:hypothetical protein LWI28_010349 [Acer negundo]KAK4840786.1 hypothetical protein QYF36_018135 [Acer negundo]